MLARGPDLDVGAEVVYITLVPRLFSNERVPVSIACSISLGEGETTFEAIKLVPNAAFRG